MKGKTGKIARHGRRVLSVFLSVLMLMSAWAIVSPDMFPKAEAATAGSYTWRVNVVSSNATGGWDTYNWKVYGKGSNGTGSETNIKSFSRKIDFKGTVNVSGDQTTSQFPTKVTFEYSFGGGVTHRKMDATIYLDLYYNGAWQPAIASATAYSYQWGTNKGTVTVTVGSGAYPKATSTSISGGSFSVSVPTDGSSTNYTNAFTAGTVYDQYGVSWYQDATLSVTSHTGVSLSSGKVAVNSNGNASNNYTVKVTATCGSASASSSNITVSVFDYKVTFYDENGTTVLKAEQTVDYGGSATAPANPTKSPDSSKHYTFAGWTGDGYTNLTSGKQTRTVKASYTGTAHSFGNWSTDTATCTNGGSHYRDCSCGYRQTESTSALGHSWVTTANANHLKTAANCVDKAVYYKWCSRCGANHPTDTFEAGEVNASNHKTTENRAAVAATCTAGGYTAGVYCTACNTWVSGHAATSSLGHSWGAWTKVDDTNHKRVCGNDASHVETAAHTWNSGEITTNPGCTTTGVKTYTCSVCNGTKTETVEASGHTWVETADADHLVSAANCVDKAVYHKYCSVCGANHPTDTFEAGEVNANNHKSTENRAAVAATCTAGGFTAGVYCTACEKWVSGHETVPAKGHDFSGAYQNVSDGKHNRKCSRCDAYGMNGTVGATEDCSGGTANCVDKARCCRCHLRRRRLHRRRILHGLQQMGERS